MCNERKYVYYVEYKYLVYNIDNRLIAVRGQVLFRLGFGQTTKTTKGILYYSDDSGANSVIISYYYITIRELSVNWTASESA